MKVFRITIVSMIIVLISSFSLNSQNQLQFQEMLTEEQMKNAGLHKLTQSELAALNIYLNLVVNVVLENYSTSTYDSYSSGIASPTSDVIESQIAGEFTGWDGETIFKLLNGQIWQQSSYAYTYHYAYMPDVTIFKIGSQYKMKVEGVSGTIFVKRRTPAL